MNAYIDTSVLLRIVLAEPRPLTEWRSIERALTSEVTRVEALRTIDRARIELRLSDRDVAERRALVLDTLDGFHVAQLDRVVLDRAAEPFPTLVRTLDAIHLSTALLSRSQHQGLVFATHDAAQATAARSVGFHVIGAASR
jgi:predicted nucleic acid-binding protein